jgi:predicted metal-dependent phosphoesterase TrpH
MRIDLHVHTTASPDSHLTVAEAFAAARKAGLNGIAVTDHNSMANIELAEEVSRREGMVFIRGVEVSTIEGHLLAYGIPAAPDSQKPLSETVDTIHKMGGVAVLAHPYRTVHGAGRRLGDRIPPLDAVETMNGHTSARTNRLASKLALDNKLPTTGGSDSHAANEVGRCYTEFELTSNDIVTLFRKGNPEARGMDLTLSGRIRIGVGNAKKRAKRGFKPL